MTRKGPAFGRVLARHVAAARGLTVGKSVCSKKSTKKAGRVLEGQKRAKKRLKSGFFATFLKTCFYPGAKTRLFGKSLVFWLGNLAKSHKKGLEDYSFNKKYK